MVFPLLAAVPCCSGCCPPGIFPTPGCHPGSWGDLLGKNALCGCSAALSRQLRVTLLMLCCPFSFHIFHMQERGSADSPWPSHLEAKEQNQLKNEFRSNKKFNSWLTGNSSVAQGRNGVSCVALPTGSQNLFMLSQGWIRLKVHCPLPPLCTGFVSFPFCSVHLVSFSDLDVLSSCQGFFQSPQSGLLTAEPKAKSSLTFSCCSCFSPGNLGGGDAFPGTLLRNLTVLSKILFSGTKSKSSAKLERFGRRAGE